MSCIPWLQVSTLEGTVKLEACTPKGLSDLTNGPTSREFTACPFFNPFFGGITTEEGVEKGYYDLLKQYIGLFVSPSSVVYPLKKDLKRANHFFREAVSADVRTGLRHCHPRTLRHYLVVVRHPHEMRDFSFPGDATTYLINGFNEN